MEEDAIQSTPMGRIWLMILVSALFVLGFSWLWHWSEIHKIEVVNHKESIAIQTNIIRLSAYRDVLKEKGKEAARIYLEQLQKTPYEI